MNAQPQTITGFRDVPAEVQQEKIFLAVPDAQRAGEHLRILTSEPHMASTPEDRKTVDYVAGKFRAMKVVSEISGASAVMIRTSWYADGVGLVKTTTEAGEIKYGSQLTDYSFKKEPRK